MENVPRRPDPLEAVRCVACGTAYVPPPRSDAACPSCGGAIWVSARLVAAEPHRGRGTAETGPTAPRDESAQDPPGRGLQP